VYEIPRSAKAVLAVTALALVTSGCGGGKSSSGPTAVSVPTGKASKGAASTPSNLPSAAPPSTGGTSQMSMRVVNLFDPNKKAGPALDIYDVQLTGQKATPIETNLAYGGVSAYFKPHLEPNTTIATLYALPAGEDPVAKKADERQVGAAQDDGSHPQLTWVLSGDDSGLQENIPLDGLSNTSWVEKGTNNGSKSPVAPPAPAGKGELLADTSATPDPSTELYLMIDDSCDPALNGDPADKGIPHIFAADGQAPDSSFALFATSPGTHQVSVVAGTSDVQPTCAQLTAKQGTTIVAVSAGQQIMTFVYGTSDTDLHLAVAPIAP
jgi:hypothetical protein